LLDENGYDNFKSYVKFIPNTRVYVALNKTKDKRFESMDYYPFCEIKFSERLDIKLTKFYTPNMN